MSNQILAKLNSMPYFTLEGFRQLANFNRKDDQYSRKILSRWQKSGEILRLAKGLYMTRDFYMIHRMDHGFYSMVSAIIRPPSYISLESILQRHGVLTEATYPVTAVSSRHTRVFENKIGTFSYRSINRSLYKGFAIFEYYGARFAEASPAKALFDYLYYYPLSAAVRRSRFNLAEELRLNLESFDEADRAEFADYAKTCGVKKMADLLNNLERNIWRT